MINGSHPIRVRDPITGEPLPCCWADCQRLGDDRYRIVVHDSAFRTVTFIFCGERHKAFYRNSHLDYGILPSGSKRLT